MGLKEQLSTVRLPSPTNKSVASWLALLYCNSLPTEILATRVNNVKSVPKFALLLCSFSVGVPTQVPQTWKHLGDLQD